VGGVGKGGIHEFGKPDPTRGASQREIPEEMIGRKRGLGSLKMPLRGKESEGTSKRGKKLFGGKGLGKKKCSGGK